MLDAVLKAIAKWMTPAAGLPLVFFLLPAFAQATGSIPSSAQSNCPQHFTGTGCESLGKSFQTALAEGEAICTQRYDSAEASLLKTFQNSLAGASGSADRGLNVNACVSPQAGPLSSTQTLATGNDILQIVAADPALSDRIDLALNLDSGLASQLSGAGAVQCRARLSGMRAELQTAKSLSGKPAQSSASPVKTTHVAAAQVSAPALGSTKLASPPTPVLVTLSSNSNSNSNPAPVTPSAPAAPAASRQPPESESPPPAAPVSPPSAPPTFITMDPAASADPALPAPVPVFPGADPSPSASPLAQARACAINTYQADMAQKLANSQPHTAVGKFFHSIGHFFSSLFGGSSQPSPEAQMEESAVNDPETAFSQLSPDQQQGYLELCAAPAVQANDATSAGTAQNGGAQPRLLVAGAAGGLAAGGANGAGPSGVSGAEGGNPLSAGAEPWPPQCVVNMMLSMAQESEDAYEKRGFFSKIYARLTGNGPPADTQAILANPQAAFPTLSTQQQVQLLTACQHEIPEDQWAFATTQTNGRFVVPDYVKTADLSAGPAPDWATISAGGNDWPPACALYAMTDEINALKAQDAATRKGLFGGMLVSLEHLEGHGAPSDADQILADPKDAFIQLSPDDQARYMKVCWLQRDASLGLTSADVLARPGAEQAGAMIHDLHAGADAYTEGQNPPQCAVDAYQKEMRADLSDYDQRGFLSKGIIDLFGNAPAVNARDAVADPGSQFRFLPSDQQITYLRACLPCPPKPKKEGFWERVHHWFTHLGFFGKLVSVLGAAVLGAVLWHIRGGWFPTGSTLAARLIPTFGMALMGFMMGGPVGALVGLLQLPALQLLGLQTYLGTAENGAKIPGLVLSSGAVNWSDTIGLSLRYLAQSAPGGLLLAAAGFSPAFIFSGLLCGLAYMLPAKFFPKLTALPGVGGGMVTSALGSGELLTGAVLFGSLAMTLLAGSGHHAPIVSCIMSH
jgi:hypothetical protein